jgi:hypothetical protein
VDVLSKIYSKFDINDKYADINIVKATWNFLNIKN